MLTRFGGFLYRERVVVLLTALALLFDACMYGPGVFHLTRSGGYDNPSSESAQAQQLLDSKLNGSFIDVLIFMRSPALRADDPAFARAANNLLSPLQARPEVVSLTSFYSSHNQLLVSRDGHETFALLQLAGHDLTIKQAEYQRLVPLLTSTTLQVTAGGDVPDNLAIDQQVNADLARAEAAAAHGAQVVGLEPRRGPGQRGRVPGHRGRQARIGRRLGHGRRRRLHARAHLDPEPPDGAGEVLGHVLPFAPIREPRGLAQLTAQLRLALEQGLLPHPLSLKEIWENSPEIAGLS